MDPVTQCHKLIVTAGAHPRGRTRSHLRLLLLLSRQRFSSRVHQLGVVDRVCGSAVTSTARTETSLTIQSKV